jgi:hypothetical protein
LDTFNKALFNHEEIISELIGVKPIQKEYFYDFDGQTKSLGAWGGDFILASSKNGKDYITEYFNNKNLHTIFNYNDLIIKP